MNIQHRFYLKSEKQQKKFIWLVSIILLCISAAISGIMYVSEFYLLFILIPFTFLIAAPFVDTPLGKRQGKFVYYSPLFITEKEYDDEVIIHGGSLFDYVFTLPPAMNGTERTRLIVLSYIQGLINLIAAYEDTPQSNIKVRGTSYIINERTARKIGFRKVRTDVYQVIILGLNVIPLTICYSYSKGKLSFPNLFNINTYEATVSELAASKKVLFELEKRLISVF